MTKKIILLLIVAAGVLGLAANALAGPIRFQEAGDVGPTFTFNDGTFNLTLSAFLTTGGTTHLFVMNEAGTTADSGKIGPNSFIQLTVPTSPASNLDSVTIDDIVAGESAVVYFTHSAGTLAGATPIGTLNANGNVPVGPLFQNGFIDVTAGSGNVLLFSANVSPLSSVPDAGFTASLLGMSLAGLTALRRKLHV
jgi:VPDSG-CTERM motif